MGNHKQLWSFTDDNCDLPKYISNNGNVKYRNCRKVPLMRWPDGAICWPVTSYLLDRYKSISTSGARGGSAGTYASQLSHIVRFVYMKRIDFSELRDDDIHEWADELTAETDLKRNGFKRRENNQTARIIRIGLNFLKWYQSIFLPDKIIVGTEDKKPQITISIKQGRRNGYVFSYIDHPAIPKPSVPQTVFPIANKLIQKLYEAISASDKSIYVKKRRTEMLRLYESTGGRRVEISKITIDDIYNAKSTGMLKVNLVKNKCKTERLVPIIVEWINPIITFIETHRKNLVDDLIKNGKIKSDNKYLFLSQKTGKRLSEETLTREISILKNIANIDEKACGHMFRHRFITLQVIYRLKEYKNQKLTNQLIHTILTKVASITGHKNPQSLLPYIDIAFDEMGVWDKSENFLVYRNKIEAALRTIQTLKHDVIEGATNGISLIKKVSDVLEEIVSCLDEAYVSLS